MDDRIRERLIRTIVGAILSSEFRSYELRDIAEELSNPFFMDEVSALVMTISADLKIRSKSNMRDQKPRATQGKFNVLDYSAQTIIEAARRRRVSKDELIDILNAHRIPNSKSISNSTLKEIIESAFLYMSPEQIDSILLELKNKEINDPYLRGMTKNKDER